MALPKTFNTGDILDAPDVDSYFLPQVARKTADGSAFTSNTTLANDPDIVIPVTAGCVYQVAAVLFYTAASGSLVGGLKWTFTVPAGTTGRYSVTGAGNGATLAAVSLAWTDTGGGDGQGTGTQANVTFSGLLVVGGTSGNLQLQVAQFNSNATATTLKANTYLTARRIG